MGYIYEQKMDRLRKESTTDKLGDIEECEGSCTKGARKLFDKYDRDKDGRISKTELRILLKKIDIELEDRQLEDLFKKADRNRKGMICFTEFYDNFVKKRSRPVNIDTLKMVFNTANIDGSGELNVDQCAHAMQCLGYKLDKTDLLRVMDKMDQ